MEPSREQSKQPPTGQSWIDAAFSGLSRRPSRSPVLITLLEKHAERVGVSDTEIVKAQRVAHKLERSCGCPQAFRDALEDSIGNNEQMVALLTYGAHLKRFSALDRNIRSREVLQIVKALQFAASNDDSTIFYQIRASLIELYKEGGRGNLLRYAAIAGANLLLHDHSTDEMENIFKLIVDPKTRFDILGDLGQIIANLACKKDLLGFLITAHSLAIELSELSHKEVAFILPYWREALSLTLPHPSGPTQITSNLNRYLEDDSDLKFVPLLLRSSVIAAVDGSQKIESLPRAVSIIADYEDTAPVLETIEVKTRSLKDGLGDTVVGMLEGVATHAIAAKLLKLKTPEAAEEAGRLFTKLKDSEKALQIDLSILPLLERLLDAFHGFGAFAPEAKRGPNRDPALIAQFGQELGQLLFINAQDIATFPGRGMVIRNLAVDKIFNVDQQKKYRDAWPHLAPFFGEFGNTDFGLMRGAIVITNASARFSYHYNAELTYYYGLVLLNDHFHNPGAVVGYLVDRKLLAKIFKNCLVSGSDSTGGYNPRIGDINQSGFSPEWLQRRARIGDGAVIPIVGGESLISGLNGDSLLTESNDYEIALKKFREITTAIQNNGYNHSSSSRPFRRMGTLIGSFSFGREMLYATEEESEKLAAAYAEVELRHVQLEKRRHNRLVEERKIRAIVEGYLNLFDLFKISYSFWKKGQTFSKSITESNGSPSERASHGSSSSIVFVTSDDSALNPASTRMLQVAYEYHGQRLEGVTSREKYVVLGSASTLKSREAPDGEFWLDTYSMTGKLAGKGFALTSGVNKPEMDDAIFWWNSVMPKVSGTKKDIRLFHPEVLKILREKQL